MFFIGGGFIMDNNGQSSSIGTSWDTDVVNLNNMPSPILSDMEVVAIKIVDLLWCIIGFTTVQLIKWANTEVISIYNIVDVAGRQCNLAIEHWDSMGQNGMVLY